MIINSYKVVINSYKVVINSFTVIIENLITVKSRFMVALLNGERGQNNVNHWVNIDSPFLFRLKLD